MYWQKKTNIQKLAKNVLAYTILADGIPISMTPPEYQK